jgi:cell division protein FtsN
MRYKGTSKNSKSLESFKFFPFIAWTLVIGFALFVYHITVTLQGEITNIQANSIYKQKQLSTENIINDYDFE